LPQLRNLIFKLRVSLSYLFMILTDVSHLAIELVNLFLKLQTLGRTLLSETLRLIHHSLILLSELNNLCLFSLGKLFCLSL
jgi:hypothetical protein